MSGRHGVVLIANGLGLGLGSGRQGVVLIANGKSKQKKPGLAGTLVDLLFFFGCFFGSEHHVDRGRVPRFAKCLLSVSPAGRLVLFLAFDAVFDELLAILGLSPRVNRLHFGVGRPRHLGA